MGPPLEPSEAGPVGRGRTDGTERSLPTGRDSCSAVCSDDVAGIIEGTFSEEGLAAMSDVQDMTSQMAKELALGIKDNVEDIAAAFKKMAIINPRRNRTAPAASRAVGSTASTDIVEMLQAETAEVPAESSARSSDAREKQALYEGLLQKSIEEQKKRKPKKRTEVENQLSLFGFVA